MRPRVGCVILTCLSLMLLAAAQQTSSNQTTPSNQIVPPLMHLDGVLTDSGGKPLTGVVGVTFYLYKEEQSGAPLWMETQNVQPDKTGHYTVLLGSTSSQGLPVSVFASGEARWLGVQAEGQPEQPRSLLVSAPYALKAADAETIGGLPPSAFVLATPGGASTAFSPASSGGGSNSSNPSGSGTQNYIPIWTDSSGDLGDSILYQSGGTRVGIGTTKPAARLDVSGSIISRGALQLPSSGTATAGGGFNSQPVLLQGSSFNSTTGKAIGPVFQWQTEPSGNNTSSPAGTLNLLYGNSSGSPAETGLNIANNGQITFATGQTFPGTGTLTGVTAGKGLTGGGSSGNVTLSIDTTFANKYYARLAAVNTFAGNQTVNGTMMATSFSGDGSALTNVNASQLGGLAASAFAQLAASGNSFSGGITAASFTGSAAGLTNLQGANVQGAVATANNALGLGGLPPGAYQPAGSYATTGSNNFSGDQNVTGNVTATEAISGGTGNFTGLVTEAGALLPASGTATATKGFASQPLDSVASAYDSATAQAVNEDFRWLAEPLGNDSGSTTGKLDLLFGGNGAIPTETGLSIAGNGQITFASGQIFPGTGNGTVTSVGSGAGLTGGPVTTSGTLSIVTGGVSNAMLTNSSLTVAAGTDLTGGGPVTLGGTTTLNLDITQVPQLSTANTFTANQTITSASGIALQATSSKQTVQVATPTLLLNGLSNGASVFSVDRSGNGIYKGGVTVGNLILGPSTGIVLQAMNTAGANVSLATPSFLVSAFSNSGDAFNVDYKGNVTVVGNLSVGGTLSKGGGSFKIDHPLDPANKYLYHSFVESPDMMDVYNGNVVTNRRGLATIILPDYFEALNRDFRYQLTVIGQFAQAIVRKKIDKNRFVIETSKPGVEVSWQVTGIRHDAYADAYRIPVEEQKSPKEQGRYLHPELFGATPEQAVEHQPAAEETMAAQGAAELPRKVVETSRYH
jgi:hypothetical protein